jgi:tRNA(Arg) A34 adenosine deaminase TadA
MTLQDLEARFAGVSAEPASYQDQQLGMVVCQEALVAARRGNYGVGAVLVNPRGTVVAQGQNAVFYPHFRSDLQAEMVVMNAFEERHPEVDTMRGYTLLSSIEPCLMCFARLLAAGVETVKFLAEDVWGGHGQPSTASARRMAAVGATASNRPSGGVRKFEAVRAGRLSCHPRSVPPEIMVALKRK